MQSLALARIDQAIAFVEVRLPAEIVILAEIRMAIYAAVLDPKISEILLKTPLSSHHDPSMPAFLAVPSDKTLHLPDFNRR
jgi:hypothetical protein